MRQAFSIIVLGLTLLPMGLAPASLHAQELDELDTPTFDSDWEFQLTPYLWLTSVDGEGTLGPLQSDVQANFGDIVDDFDVWGVMGRLEARRGRLSLFLDGMYISADKQETFTRGPVAAEFDADFELSTVELGAAYELFDHRFDDGPGGIAFEALGGGRYTHYEQALGATGLGPFGITENLGGNADWVDPFVGGRIRLDLTDTLSLRAYGDVGGFDVGDAELSWKARALLDWRVNQNISLLGGYQVYGLDFEEGSGRGRIGFDGHFHGPIFGVGLRF
ncbi:MAG: hypothetical protein WD534_05580 [Phycisphaeraceae bacterium]